MSVIGDMLRLIGIGPRYRGHRFLVLAVELAMREGAEDLLVTKTIYPEVARAFQTSWQCVERNIRTVVRHAWEMPDHRYLDALAGHHLESRPSNGEFIRMLAGLLRDAARDSRVGALWVWMLSE